MVNPMLARWARVQWKRIRRREFSVLRKPQATPDSGLQIMTPSVRALVRSVCRNARIAGHQASIVVARRCTSGMAVRGALAYWPRRRRVSSVRIGRDSAVASDGGVVDFGDRAGEPPADTYGGPTEANAAFALFRAAHRVVRVSSHRDPGDVTGGRVETDPVAAH